jgi:putative aminopeptidase FrvX
MHESLCDTVCRLLPLPTAPYHEHHIAAEIRRYASERGLAVEADEFGNLMLRTPGATPSGLCLTAHMDHPALGFGVRESTRDIFFEKLGGVPTQLTRNARVVLYNTTPAQGLPEPVGRGSVTAFLEEGLPGSDTPCPAFRVRVDDDIPNDDSVGELFAVLDLPPFTLDGNIVTGIACDDLVGVCVALATVDRCRAQGVGVSVLLTRAEETGFGGMLAAVRAGGLPADDIYINIECSSCRAGAPLGDGPVIRVGDRRWIFDAGVTEALTTCADELAGDGFRVQRRLMDGGVCEATPLSRSGRRTGAVALPLDNYHNNGGDRLRTEAVHLQDGENLVALLTHFAQKPGARAVVDDSVQALDDRLASRGQQQLDRLQRRRIPVD